MYLSKFLNSSGEYDLVKVKAHSNFLNLALPYIAEIEVSKNPNGKYSFASMANSLAKLMQEEGSVSLGSGEKAGAQELIALFKLFANHSRSEYLEPSQSKTPGLSAAVPLVLKAYKMYKHIKYEDWDWNARLFADKMEGIVGKGLAPMLDYIHDTEDWTFMSELPELRVRAQRSSKGAHLNSKSIYMAKTEDAMLDSLPKNIRYMLLQWWVWHPSIRHEDMIMDLNNLDSMPIPLEVSKVNEVIADVPW